ncbi:hypothetical protein K503DRAFT_784458 [Rhizopogon vinicolor AM-OR11-026]|uniref:Uncharacterized protein n=1 Tax=Rhizopogon vinicolor AM-OR11-026 TaxID=1314800 RepID=A0A1B7MUN2_9AGAM|nr:hypothetical protein K503DRAFT_784458 [Rhizopogon vinicolor AM-OR11-026]
MSPASQWFSKRTPKSPISPSLNVGRSVSADKLSLHSKNSDGFKFSNFASMMGRKSKKSRPTLVIPDCPVPPLVSPSPVQPSDSPQYTNRPPAKSISSTVRSGYDSLEPRTPLDVLRDRGSLPLSVLSLSDDPFAAGAISVPQSILDRGRLSVYSSTSANNMFSNKDEVDLWQRPSSASTSSQSHGWSNGIPSFESTWSPLSPKADGRSPWSRGTTKNNEGIDEHKSPGSPVECSYLDEISRASLSKYGSLSTLTGQNRKGSPDSPAAAVRPTIRTRCYTVADSSQRASTVSASPSAGVSVRSRTLSCRQSISPVSPTTSRVSPELPDDGAELPSSAVDTSSCSSISFTSSNRVMQDLATEEMMTSRYRPYREFSLGFDPADCATLRQPVKESSHIHVRNVMESSPALPAFHQLKKSMSHSTLQKAKLGSGNSNALQDLSRGNKELKRQYSFHQSRRDVPTSMPASNATTLGHDLPSNESRKPSLPYPQAVVRKRLFSGSSKRPSTIITDEDIRSVFSLPTEAERSYVASTRAVVSLLDEPSSEALASGMVYPVMEFAPQHIMSPAEMLKVDAIVQDEFDAKYGEAVRNRQRGTTPMYGTSYTKEGLSMAPTSFPRLASTRNANVPEGPTSTSSMRPSSAQAASSPVSISPSSSTTLSRLGPPPTPRPRTRPHTAETIYDEDLFNRRISTVPFTPLSPPPPRLKRPNRAPSIMSETLAPQRSVMRKPSFLEIADEASSYDGSFLEFDSGKESLDL